MKRKKEDAPDAMDVDATAHKADGYVMLKRPYHARHVKDTELYGKSLQAWAVEEGLMIENNGKWMIAQGTTEMYNGIYDDVDDAVDKLFGSQFRQRWKKHPHSKEDFNYVRIRKIEIARARDAAAAV